MIEIKCTLLEQSLIKRNIKATGCKLECCYKEKCHKPESLTCGQYIVSMIKWVITDD